MLVDEFSSDNNNSPNPSTHPSYPFSVTVSFWENQRFDPIMRKWNQPWKSDKISAYSDLDGTISVEFDEESNNASIDCPSGWLWLPHENESEWSIDKSETYGQCDTDGWSYSSNFDTLIQATLSKSLHGKMGRLSLVRRRRWVRKRICKSEEAKSKFSRHVVWTVYLRNRIEKIMLSKLLEFSEISLYEDRRKKVYEELLLSADMSLDDTFRSLALIANKLDSMNQFLLERSQVEREYANCLQNISTKWINAGNLDNSLPFPPPSTSVMAAPKLLWSKLMASTTTNIVKSSDSKAEVAHNEQLATAHQVPHGHSLLSSQAVPLLPQNPSAASTEPAAENIKKIGHNATSSEIRQPQAPAEAGDRQEKGFFYTISMASSSVAGRLHDFADMLSAYLPQDVKNIRDQLELLKMDYHLERPRLRHLISDHISLLDEDFNQYKSAFEICQSRDQYLFKELLAAVYDVNPTLEMGSKRPGTMSLKQQAEQRIRTILFTYTDSVGHEINIYDPSLSNSSLHCNQDVWLKAHHYKRLSNEVNSSIFMYNAYAQQFKKETLKVASRVSALLQATVKIFAFEQTRVWDDATAILKSIAPSNKFDRHLRNASTEDHNDSPQNRDDLILAISSDLSEAHDAQVSNGAEFYEVVDDASCEENDAFFDLLRTFPSKKNTFAHIGKLKFNLLVKGHDILINYKDLESSKRSSTSTAATSSSLSQAKSWSRFSIITGAKLNSDDVATLGDSRKVSLPPRHPSSAMSSTSSELFEESLQATNAIATTTDVKENDDIKQSTLSSTIGSEILPAWRECIAVISYEGFLHVFPTVSLPSQQNIVSAKSLRNLNNYVKSQQNSTDHVGQAVSLARVEEAMHESLKEFWTDEEMVDHDLSTENIQIPNPESDLPPAAEVSDAQNDLLEMILSAEPIFSINTRQVEVSPCILPVLGTIDAFEIRPKVAKASALLPSAVVYFQANHSEITDWLKVLSNPYADRGTDLLSWPDVTCVMIDETAFDISKTNQNSTKHSRDEENDRSQHQTLQRPHPRDEFLDDDQDTFHSVEFEL